MVWPWLIFCYFLKYTKSSSHFILSYHNGVSDALVLVYPFKVATLGYALNFVHFENLFSVTFKPIFNISIFPSYDPSQLECPGAGSWAVQNMSNAEIHGRCFKPSDPHKVSWQVHFSLYWCKNNKSLSVIKITLFLKHVLCIILYLIIFELWPHGISSKWVSQLLGSHLRFDDLGEPGQVWVAQAENFSWSAENQALRLLARSCAPLTPSSESWPLTPGTSGINTPLSQD